MNDINNNENISMGRISDSKIAIIDLIAGAAGGTLCVYVGQPLDTVKVKLQTFPTWYSGMGDCFYMTFKRDGFRGLYAGTVPALVANIAENSILFASYGICQKSVAMVADIKKVEDLSLFQNASSGFFAAFFSSLALCPTELVKCRLQAMRELSFAKDAVVTKMSPWKLTRNILTTDGVPGLFRGLTSTFSREMPGYFFFFGGYEGCRMFFTPPGKTKDDIGSLRTVISGGVAGVIFWSSIFPTDVVKSRIQVTGSKDPMMKVMTHIVKTEGIYALYNGLWPTLIRSFPATGALFLAFEYTKKCLTEVVQ